MPLKYGEEDKLLWRKAIRSMNNGACAEVASMAGVVAVRDSKDPGGPVVRYPAGSWRFFVAAARKGDYDGIR